jgi:hypothetical protein
MPCRADAPIPETQLWRESNKYTDQPPRMISWAYRHLGEPEQALAWALRARERIGTSDQQWDQHIALLRQEPQILRSGSANKIAVCRPGAIGDVLMTLNLIPLLRSKYPGHAIHYFCSPAIGDALGHIMRAAGIDTVEDSDQFASRRNEYVHALNLIGYPLHEGYPEKPMRQHLLRYFAEELGLDPDELPSLRPPQPPRPGDLPERFATLQIKAGWSAYKNWPVERWASVLRACPEIPVYQIGEADEPRVSGARHQFMAARCVWPLRSLATRACISVSIRSPIT